MTRQLILTLVTAIAALQAVAQKQIVTIDQVGAAALPEGAPRAIEAPFTTGDIIAPSFPDRTDGISRTDISSRGLITPAINDKIAALSAAGGGTLVVPAGQWRSGRIILKSNVNLHLAHGAVIEFSAEPNDYLPVVFTRHEGVEVMGAGAFIYADSCENIALTGEGTIMGPPMDAPMRSLPNGNSVVENDIDWRMPVEMRICDGTGQLAFYRPKSFAPIRCKNVLVDGVTFERSVLWNINPIYCENVIIRGVTVNSTDVPSGDGIDLSSCRDVLIEYCTLNCGDDCFTLKAGRCEDGLRVARPTENVIIRYCLAKDGHGGMTCGSETAGGIRNVYVHHCVFDGTRSGIRFKTRRNRGGRISDITCDNLRFVNVREAFTWDLLGSPVYMGDLARRDTTFALTPLTPIVAGIEIGHFIVEGADRMASVQGIPEVPCGDITISDGTVNTGVLFKTLSDVNGLTMRNLNITATSGDITADNAANITFDGCSLTLPSATINLDILGDQPSTISIQPAGGQPTLLRQGANKL